ncbi:TPA: hypothetical protein U1D20_001420 [Streptococcus suis]|nr:hypothetical protein [Streptococcus suis]
MKDSNLQAIVISLSLADNWEEARQEWTRVKLEKIDKTMESKCLCGKAHLQKVYSVSRTDLSDIKLSPIGSSCIKKFQNKKLTKSLKKAEREFRLRSNSDFSSLKEIMDLDSLDEYYQKGYFKADRGNRYDPWNDYQLFKLALSGKQSERQLAFHKMERILYVVNDYLRPELNQVFDVEDYLKKLRRWKLHDRVAAALRKNALERENLLAQREREAERERQRQLDLQRWTQKKQDLLAWLDGQSDKESIALKNSLDSQTEDREICHKIEEHQIFLKRKEAQERLAIAELERKQARVKCLFDWLRSQNRLDDLKTVQTIESLDNQLFMLEKWHSDYVHHRRMEQRQQDELLCVVLELRRQVKKYYPYTERAKKCIEFVDGLGDLQEQHDWLQRFLELMKKCGF